MHKCSIQLHFFLLSLQSQQYPPSQSSITKKDSLSPFSSLCLHKKSVRERKRISGSQRSWGWCIISPVTLQMNADGGWVKLQQSVGVPFFSQVCDWFVDRMCNNEPAGPDSLCLSKKKKLLSMKDLPFRAMARCKCTCSGIVLLCGCRSGRWYQTKKF